MKKYGFLLLVPALLVSSLLCAGQAAPASRWSRITPPNDATTNEVALVRTKDSQLQVAWRQAGEQQDWELLHTVIDANGNVSPEPKIIVKGWTALSGPALVVDRDGTLRAYFSGVQDPQTDSPYNLGSLYSARNNYGGSWRLIPGQLSAATDASSGNIAAALGNPGIVAAWGSSVQTELSPTTQPLQLQDNCCAYTPEFAADSSSGQLVVGWYSNASSTLGLFAETVSPSVGQKLAVPGSVSNYQGAAYSIAPDQQVAISGRIGAPGVYLAFCEGYPTATSVDLWQYGSARRRVIANVRGGCHVHVSAGPQGRLWLMWADQNKVFASRSNRELTRFGDPVVVDAPESWHITYRIKGEGSAGPLDIFAHMDVASSASTWHIHVLPALSVAATPLSAAGGKVTLTVTEAGDPVAGAIIRVAGQTLTSDARGLASIKLLNGGPFPVSVTAQGYSEARLTLATAITP